MARIESSIFVSQPVEEIFSFLNSCESHRKFIPRMTELHQTSPGVFGHVGTRLSGMLNYLGIRIPVQYELIEIESNRRLAMKGQMGPFQFKDGYLLSRNGNRTEIKFWLDLLPTGWVKIFSPFMGLIGRIHAWETMRNLKRELSNITLQG
ncbi:MAG TPA: SRPBCC family protein [Anaerolineales bacterium]|nr:SRPBCC family protein [Anaerolineales bacterium]